MEEGTPDPAEGSAEDMPVYEPGEVRGMELDRFKYLQPGRLAVGRGSDGLPVIQGEPPEGPEPGLTEDNLVCIRAAGRPQCRHLRGLLSNAPGVARGYERMKMVRRFCMALSTGSELFDLDGVDIFACLSRDPVDEASLSTLEAFEERQKREAREAAQTSGDLEW